MQQNARASIKDNGVRAAGTLAAATVGALAIVPSVSQAAVIAQTPNLTTSLVANDTPTDGNIFFDFNTMSATTSLSALPTYQFRLATYGTGSGIPSLDTGSNGVVSNGSFCPSARKEAAGDIIGPGGAFVTGNRPLSGVFADFSIPDSGYVGLSFALTGVTHYGWADIAINSDSTITLKQFAYETMPNNIIAAGSLTSVVVPEANPLALLAAGAVALGAFRLATAKRPEPEADATASA